MNLRKIVKDHWDIIAYLLFGVLTTVVNFLVYTPLYQWVGFSAVVSNCISWIAAVIVAFATNKPFVFKSYNWSLKVVIPEFGKFIGCRIGSGLLETAILWLTVDFLGWSGLLMKIIASVFVVIINYVGSKLFVFCGNSVKADGDDNLI